MAHQAGLRSHHPPQGQIPSQLVMAPRCKVASPSNLGVLGLFDVDPFFGISCWCDCGGGIKLIEIPSLGFILLNVIVWRLEDVIIVDLRAIWDLRNNAVLTRDSIIFENWK